MNKYELTVVVSSKLEDEARAEAVAKVQAYVTRLGGTVTDVTEGEKKKLAYSIQKMNEAYYYFMHFEAEPTALAELDANLRIMEPVLRYLCVKEEA